MAQHKFLQDVGTPALCGHVKDIRHAAEDAGDAVVAVSEALQDLASEVEDSINELDTAIENLTNAVIAGEVNTPLGNRAKVGITTRSGIEIYALRLL